jgi:hypothetical protein
MQQKIRMALTLAVALFSCTSIFAQSTVEEKKKEINAIKKNSDYIYAEATMADQQAAIDLAKEILYQNVNEWVAKQKKFAGASNVITVNTNYSVEDMTLPRGNWFRAFMYVKKTDIIPAGNVTVMKVVQKEPETVEVTPSDPEIKPESPEDIIKKQLLECENTGQMSTLLKNLKAEGKITDYQKLNTITSPNEYIIAIFSKEGVIRAILSEGAERTNLKTGQPDQISNYKGNGAIGIKIKK